MIIILNDVSMIITLIFTLNCLFKTSVIRILHKHQGIKWNFPLGVKTKNKDYNYMLLLFENNVSSRFWQTEAVPYSCEDGRPLKSLKAN